MTTNLIKCNKMFSRNMCLGDRDTQIYALQKSMDRCTLYKYQLLKTYNLVNIKSICASLSTDVNLILDVIV